MSEIEVKILDIDAKEIQSELMSLGAQLVKNENQMNYIYDFEGDPLSKKHKGYCRIRVVENLLDGSKKNILTVKKMISQEKYKNMLEEETEVADAEIMKKILIELGMHIRHANYKKRVSYKLNDVLYEFDEWDKEVYPKPYLEVEAENEAKLIEGIRIIGFELEDTTSKNLGELRKDLGLE